MLGPRADTRGTKKRGGSFWTTWTTDPRGPPPGDAGDARHRAGSDAADVRLAADTGAKAEIAGRRWVVPGAQFRPVS